MGTLSERNKEYQALFDDYKAVIEMQLSLSIDRMRAAEYWKRLLQQADLSVLSDVLAAVLNEAGYKVLSK
ncbi:hypothetical protein VP018_002762 [Morganella morganii]|uniref:hypothetical protein n=1 Tax=Morganella morganii TaxID=582 RepID=UPI0007DB8894|nr:hypothetical protein [Morganella morganii]HDS7362012.1 hypothetical protein [Morganella morganii subsp. morganii]EHZ6677677.1 hypothetical protein [Morganella morganii]EKU8060726.1 hypothetical protein [Morganella morganii]EMD0830902.1 hypothetical protein [Morganella morganii]MBA5858736.1 hypothetical protein [Morganella morganii]